MTRASLLAALLLALLGGCGEKTPDGPIDVSVVGAPLARPLAGDTADRAAIDAPAAALIAATRQGLVRLDATGQIIPGLAARWSVSDDGRSLLFRLPDGTTPFTAQAIARRLRAAGSPRSRNPLAPLLGAVARIEAVTPQVIDVELSAPRPTLLPIFAQPLLGIGDARHGGGPFAITRLAQGVASLRALPDRDADPDETLPPPLVVRLRGERAATAVVRFVAGRARLVAGGRFADLPIARAAGLPPDRLRFDPVAGLFGLAFDAQRAGVAANPQGRRALAMAIDRDRVARALGVPGWTPSPAILPDATPEIAEPAQPDWATLSLADRRTAAGAAIAATKAAGVPLRVAMPPGPGARLLFALVAADWRAIGVQAISVPTDAPADLHLIDVVSPADTAAFYLRHFACASGVPCTPQSDAALDAARTAPTLAERSAMLGQADRLIEADTPFIAFGPPIRWSLVDPSLDLFRASPRAFHPLDELRTPVAR